MTTEQEIEKQASDVEPKQEQVSAAPTPPAPEENWKENYLRLRADLENMRKNYQKERVEFLTQANRDFIKKILPIFDDFDRSVSANLTGEPTPFQEGIFLIFNKFKNILQTMGLEEMDPNKPFDVEFHEAVARIPMPDKSGQIIEIIEKGYLLNGKIIRHAKVVVAE